MCNLISIPYHITGKNIISYILTKLNGKLLLISEIDMSFENVKITSVNNSLSELQHTKYDHILIFNIFPFDDLYRSKMEILLIHFKVILILYNYDFSMIRKWGLKSNVISINNSTSINVLGYEKAKNDYLFELKLNYKILPFVSKKTLIYCATKKNCKLTAEFLLKEYSSIIKPSSINAKFEDSDIRQFVERKIGYLNSDVSKMDSEVIINLFRNGTIEILVVTHKVYEIKADTIIFKSTKTYSKKGYIEMSIPQIVDLCTVCQENSNVFIMTVKEKANYYKKIFSGKDKFNFINSLVKSNEEIFRDNVLEFILYELYCKRYNFDITKTKIMNSLMFFVLKQEKIDIDVKEIISNAIDFLLKKRILIGQDLNCNIEIVNKYMCDEFSFASFIIISELSGTAENIINKIVSLQENKIVSNFNTKTDKKINQIQKIKLNVGLANFILSVLQLSFDLKSIFMENQSDVLILISKLKSKDPNETLQDVNFYQNTAQSRNIGLKLDNYRLICKFNSHYEFYFLIEKSKIVIHSLKIINDFDIEIKLDDYCIYCICMNDYKQSMVLNINNNLFSLNAKYYKNDDVFKYIKKPKKEQYECRRETEIFNNTKIEFYIPDKITVPKWFTK